MDIGSILVDLLSFFFSGSRTQEAAEAPGIPGIGLDQDNSLPANWSPADLPNL
jgi:hypothetical protein